MYSTWMYINMDNGFDSMKKLRRLDTKLPQLAEYTILLLGDLWGR